MYMLYMSSDMTDIQYKNVGKRQGPYIILCIKPGMICETHAGPVHN